MPDLVSMDEMKTHLDIPDSDTSNDVELKDFITSATRPIEAYIGIVIPRTFVERHVDGPLIRLQKGPVLSITSIEGFLKPLAVPINVATDIVLDGANSAVYRVDEWPFCDGPYRVTYQAGRISVEQHHRQAAKIIIAHMWTTQRGQMVRFPQQQQMEQIVTPSGTYSVPRKALELLRDEARDRVVIA